MSGNVKNLVVAVLVAAILWFWMFSPWTGHLTNFWLSMSLAAAILTYMTVRFSPREKIHIEKPVLQVLAGIAIAFALWGVFWIGDKASAWLFDFARPQVDNVYAMKTGIPDWGICTLLLVLIGPAEELFWRGYVQRTMSGLLNPDKAFFITAAIYALVHIWSFNFMLVMAALVAGAVWGIIYRFCPKALPALVISHALWDALVFVLLPI